MTDNRTRCFDCFYATYEGFCRYYLKYTLFDMVSCSHFIEDGGRARILPRTTAKGAEMTDNRTTELLRKLLDERGVEWWESRGYGTGIVYTFWHSPTFGRVHAIENDDGTLFMACLNNCDFTPEQAIAATLGEYSYDWQAIADELNARAERTCHNTHENRWFKCSACGYGFTDLYAEDEGDIDEQPRYCPNCGCKVVDA